MTLPISFVCVVAVLSTGHDPVVRDAAPIARCCYPEHGPPWTLAAQFRPYRGYIAAPNRLEPYELLAGRPMRARER